MKTILILIVLILPMCSDAQRIFLTFDDGPSLTMDTTLDILKENNVKATFFVCGICCQGLPDIVKRAVNEGHLIASHSHRHANFSNITSDSIVPEFNIGNRVIRNVTGTEIVYFRFPQYGYNSGILNWVKDKGFIPVETNNDPNDWNESLTTSYLLNYILTHLLPSGDNVVNLHSMPSIVSANQTKKQTNSTLRLLIPQAKALGYTFHILDPTVNYNGL